ncbi:helicase [Streptomyces sp. WAC 06725]|uniref:DEAD/DEAH box helicase n=1 Tax=Streptomyces sp. WAC 06725 TaxID=2203209 RepID=UPI000F736B6B|nr:DEAD/DEAH box helicase [Streptomyces sp. WAC 06725]RSO20590.1 helicase [Streptomyces sp. WAC 06725]
MTSSGLWRHQAEADDAIFRGLSVPPDGVVPAGGLRGTVVMATGTGKTRLAAVSARRLVPRGRVGVMVPTLELLTQTVETWRAMGHQEPMIAVCSLGADPLLETLGVRCTTNPTQLALWASAGGPVTIFATYASLVPQGLEDEGADTEVEDGGPGQAGDSAPGVLERAMRGSYGQRLGTFDLLIIDEAHRTSGDLGKKWASVLDNERIPATRRLFMTATPRLWEVQPGPGGTRRRKGEKGAEERSEAAEGDAGGVGRLVASMDDIELYGPVLFEFGLMEAIERGVLASFEIDVLEIRDPEMPGEGASVEEVRGRRLAALQAALLKHLSTDALGTRSLLSFHWRTIEAMAAARALPETAAELYEMDPAVYPKRVGAEWLCGEHPAQHRRQVLGRFADGLDADGWVNDVQILHSCQVLSEGVDIRGRRGVDGVIFADTRSSPVQIVQITGRGLRQNPGEGKVARLIVPVFLEPGEAPQDMMASTSYRPLVAVLQGLRAHDSRITQRLLLGTRTARGRATSVVGLDPDAESDADADESSSGSAGAEVSEGHGGTGNAVDGEGQGAAETETTGGPAPAPEDGADGGLDDGVGGAEGSEAGVDGRRKKKAQTPLLRFSLPKNPDVVAAFLRTRVLQPDSEVWLAGLNALRIWVEENGNAQVPLDGTVVIGEDGGRTYRLGAWVSEQRRAFRAGTLKAWRAELLDGLGMVWSVADAKFIKNLSAARTYYAVHGTLAAPKDAVADGVAVGQWLANLRKAGGLGTNEERAMERRRLLESLDADWNPVWPVDWQRRYVLVRRLVEDDGATPDEIRSGVVVDGEDIGRWLKAQREGWEQLHDGQRERLTALDITPTGPDDGEDQDVVEDGPVGTEAFPNGVPGLAHMTAFERGIAALTQYQARENTLTVPRKHTETLRPAEEGGEEVAVRLGVWLSNTKTRRAKLTPEQHAVLASFGLEWAAT